MVLTMSASCYYVRFIFTEGLISSRLIGSGTGTFQLGSLCYYKRMSVASGLAVALPKNERRALKKYYHTPENAWWLSHICLLVLLLALSSLCKALFCSVI